MTLTVHNQLRLLHDILSEQTEDCCGEISEYQQIKRLVQAMMANNSISDEQLLQLLPEIYNYGRQGEIAQNDEEHITTNQENIKTWVSAIQQTNLE
ncbi:YtzH-like protein [Virgibacillus subterraneus]|uniref:YtzH-like protein n=2 Tax=Virgibacillus TaxID=84406 RepID=A0A1H1ARD2_9BACI|nr:MULTISPECIES: YtzH-like family protein [Virgibacillus]SDQ41726.1 YtzH-like protein [Virgibacillus salinus]SEQ09175.1 YtzH-like protein [Virgibacillus subterraneus]